MTEQAICPDCGQTVALDGGKIVHHGVSRSGLTGGAWFDPPFCPSSGKRVDPLPRPLNSYHNLNELLADIRPIKVILCK